MKTKLEKFRGANWRAIVKSYLRTFVVALGVALTALMSNKIDAGVSVFTFNANDALSIIGVGLFSTFAPLFRALDKSDSAFGRGSK